MLYLLMLCHCPHDIILLFYNYTRLIVSSLFSTITHHNCNNTEAEHKNTIFWLSDRSRLTTYAQVHNIVIILLCYCFRRMAVMRYISCYYCYKCVQSANPFLTTDNRRPDNDGITTIIIAP